ncbi:MAG TPA: histidinol-phosphate transaminase [Candidatus Binatia bacterium]|nr:histidinol-phosphate transaminase [Candidatus Binatia bacterium]
MPAQTPASMASPTKPASWSWEATSESVAERYGIPVEQVVRFDQNTSPAPPELVPALLAEGRFEVALSEYPPSDYRRLIEAACDRYGVAFEEVLVGAGADECLDLSSKAFLPHGGTAIVPVPTYPMYGILTDQRRASTIRVPRRTMAEGFALDVEATRAAVAEAGAARPDPTRPAVDLVWLCNPNNPTATREPDGTIEALLAALRADAEAAGRPLPTVLLDEAYVEFGSGSLLALRHVYPRLVVLRTLSKAYGIAGLRVGFAIALPDVIEEIAVYRPPGSVSVVSVDVGAALLRDPHVVADRVATITAERDRFIAALREAGWDARDSVTNFVLVKLASPEAADIVAEGLLSRGLIPRTFPSGHPLDHCVRLTVRNREQNDRLVAAAREIGSGS